MERGFTGPANMRTLLPSNRPTIKVDGVGNEMSPDWPGPKKPRTGPVVADTSRVRLPADWFQGATVQQSA